MTNKEVSLIHTIIIFLLGFVGGLVVGAGIVDARINSEIRADQVELQAKVEEIIEDKQIIEDLISELLQQIEYIKAERQELRELKILFSSKGG